jgi:hypothetical protein
MNVKVESHTSIPERCSTIGKVNPNKSMMWHGSPEMSMPGTAQSERHSF